MSLDRALQGMLADRSAERTVRDVLTVLMAHKAEWLSSVEIAHRVERSEPTISTILSKLAAAFVVEAEGSSYRLQPDPVVDMDVRRFLRRSDAHNQYAQDNLTRFRDRFGHH